LNKSTALGESKAQAQSRVRASARPSVPPESQPEIEVLGQKPRNGREIRRPGASERRYIHRSGAAVDEAQQCIQLQKTRPH